MTKAIRPLCFILMPFVQAASVNGKYENLNRDNLDTIFDLLKRIIQRLGYEVRRSSSRGDILAGIILDLDRSDLVVADLTGLNPNVMYELGIRHGFTKKTVLLSQDISELPFDLKNYHCIEYAWKNKNDREKVSKDIRETLKEIENDPDVRFGPVHSHLGTKRLALREEELRQTSKRLGALASELHLIYEPLLFALKQTKQLHSDVFEEVEGGLRIKGDLDWHKPNPFFQAAVSELPNSFPAMDLLLTSRYIPDDLDFNEQITIFYQYLGGLRFSYLKISDYTFENLVNVHLRVQMILSDVVLIQIAINKGELGVDLKLNCVHALAAEQSGSQINDSKTSSKLKRKSKK